MRKKALIITEFNRKTTNYGNILQSYALQKILKDKLNVDADTIVRKYYGKNIVTSPVYYYSMLKNTVKKTVHRKGKNADIELLRGRKTNFRAFEDNKISFVDLTWKELNNSTYDYYIVGSDKVWTQKRSFIERLMFIDFLIPSSAVKLSYAASFGNDWIPQNNKKQLHDMLKSFLAISVREKSSVELLRSIDIDFAKYVLDPTLLLSDNEWRLIEKKPEAIKSNDEYIFVYLLETNREKSAIIKNYANYHNVKIVNIPYANGAINNIDEAFGDLLIYDCDPAEWIWLIDHAKLVLTDSFHCLAFSSNLSTPFYIFPRNNGNNRLADYLKEIDSEYFWISNIDKGEQIWDFENISNTLDSLRSESFNFLENAFTKQ